MGPKACLLAWLPVVGDPLCAVAGWLKLPVCETEDINVELPSQCRREYKTLEKELMVELANRRGGARV
jgi:hypothetical protein